jgi:hypothetical protein
MKRLTLAALAASTLLLARNASSQEGTNSVASSESGGLPRIMLHPVILSHPDSQTISAGATVSLSVAFDSVLPPVSSGKLELWLTADAGVVTDAYGRVRQWQDQSENRNDALQPSASLEPLLVFPTALGGRPSVRFEGLMVMSAPGGGPHHVCTGTYLKGDGQVDIPGAMTSFCVHMLAAPSTREYALWMVGETNPKVWGECRADAIVDDEMRFAFWGGADFNSGFAVPEGQYRIRTDRLIAGLNSMDMIDTSVTGTVKFSVPTSNARPPGLGYFVGGLDPNETTGRNLNGDIAELIIYQGALSDVDLKAVTDYLRDKYFPSARLKEAAFQWLFNGKNIADATNATLVLTDIRASMSGAYSVMVSNASGVVVSSNAVISVTTSAPSRSP